MACARINHQFYPEYNLQNRVSLPFRNVFKQKQKQQQQQNKAAYRERKVDNDKGKFPY